MVFFLNILNSTVPISHEVRLQSNCFSYFFSRFEQYSLNPKKHTPVVP